MPFRHPECNEGSPGDSSLTFRMTNKNNKYLMKKVKFRTHEVGSLTKLEWRRKPIVGKKPTKEDIDELLWWAKKLDVDYQPLVKLLKRKKFGKKTKKQIQQWASLFAIKMEEKAGLDIVYDGEQQRSEMYHYPITHSQGFKFLGNVRSFDNKYYQIATCIDKPSLKKPYHVDELLFNKTVAQRQLKLPITGPYTLAAWSFDQYYVKGTFAIGSKKAAKQRKKSREQFILDIARYILQPNIKKLIQAGATWIQIDEPAATTIPEEVPLFVKAFNLVTKELKCRFSTHICFSDYRLLFPHILKMQNCHAYSLELANRDSKELGITDEKRPSYQILKYFKKQGFKSKIGLGVIDIHTNFIEPPELVRDRILYTVKILKDPLMIYPATDCGLRTRTWEVAYKKLTNLVKGTKLAEEVLNK